MEVGWGWFSLMKHSRASDYERRGVESKKEEHTRILLFQM